MIYVSNMLTVINQLKFLKMAAGYNKNFYDQTGFLEIFFDLTSQSHCCENIILNMKEQIHGIN